MSDLSTADLKPSGEVSDDSGKEDTMAIVAESDVGNDEGTDNDESEEENDDEEDDDEDDSQNSSDSASDVYIDPTGEEDEATEEPYVPLTADDIPAILEALEASDSETWNAGLNKLNNIICKQQEFAASNLSLLDLPRLINAATTTTDGTLRTCILDIVTSFPDISDEARQAVVSSIPNLIPFLAKPNETNRHYVLNLLEHLADAEPSSHDLILAGARSLYFPVRKVEEDTADEAHLTAIIGSFESALLYSREQCRKFFVQGFAVDAVIACTQVQKFAKVRLAAASCFVQMLQCVPEIEADLPDETDRGHLVIYIFMRFFQLLKDADDEVRKGALQFVAQDRGEGDAMVFGLVVEYPDVVPAIILQLAKKEPNHVGVPAEFALIKFLENDESKSIVINSFQMVWDDEKISAETKFKVVSGLVDSFLDLRKIALEGGLCGFMMREFGDENNAVGALTVLARLMDQEQIVGSVMFKTPGMIDKLVDIFEGPLSEVRCLAAKVLKLTLDAYDFDSQACRPEFSKALFQPNIFPRLLAGLHSNDLPTIDASAKLIGEILATEEGTKAWSYDEDSGSPPEPSPMKDAAVTEELVHHVVGLLKRSETAPGALHLLCQISWGYQRGFDILRKTFELFIPGADVFFFAGMYGEYEGKHSGRQRRVVAEAAVQAGAIPRAAALIEEELDTVELRRAAVEGFRVLLAAESADLSVGRTHPKLPSVLAKLLTDDTVQSMHTVAFMVRLLSDEDNSKVFESWATNFATAETVQHLLYWLNKPPPTFERPDVEKMTEEEFRKADEEYDKKVSQADREDKNNMAIFSELLGYLIPLLTPFASQLVRSMLNATNKDDQNDALVKLLALFTSNETILEDSLVPAIKDLLAQDPPPALSTCFYWILYGPSLAKGFYIGGLLERVAKVYEPVEEEDGETVTYSSHQALQIYEHLVTKLEDSEQKLDVQKAFFAFKPALNQALEFLRNKDHDVYEAFQVAGELYELSKDYPDGLAILENEGVYSRLLELFNNTQLSAPAIVGPLIGSLCHQNVEALTTLLKSFILGLIPPPEGVQSDQALGRKGQKGKRGRKKKNFKPRITLSEVLERCVSLVNTTPSARKALSDAGAIELANSAVAETDEDLRTSGLAILTAFANSDDGHYHEVIAKLLPSLANLITVDCSPLLEIVRLARSFITPVAIQYVIDADMHRALFKVMSDFPGAIGDMEYIIETIRDLGDIEASRQPLIEVMKASLEAEDAFEMEQEWGNAHALRRLLHEGESSSKLVVDAGAVDYAIRMLKAEDLHIAAIGSALSVTLARNEFVGSDVREKLLELGAANLIEEAHSKCVEASKIPFDEKSDGDEDEYKEKHATNKTWIDILETSLKVVNGEEVEGFEENFFL